MRSSSVSPGVSDRSLHAAETDVEERFEHCLAAQAESVLSVQVAESLGPG